MFATFAKCAVEFRRCRAAIFHYDSNPLAALQRYWSLYHRRRFSPDEIHFQRLLDPSLTESDLLRAVSKEELLAVQAQLNPQAFHARTEDKVEFDRFCRERQLPVADILAIYDGQTSLRADRFPQYNDAGGLDSFLRDTTVDCFILKPVAGVSGDGVMRLERDGKHWRDSRGAVFDAAAILEAIARTGYTRWLFQQVVCGHPILAELSNTSGLQTVRVVTLVDKDEQVRVLAARLRLIGGDAAYDNFKFGKTGNVIAILNPDSGRVESAFGGARARYEIQAVTHHPRTGRDLIGFQVPDWPAVRELAVVAARAFMPLRSIGWDVAVTPDAPLLIEGNVTWDTLSGEARMGEIYRELRELAESLSR